MRRASTAIWPNGFYIQPTILKGHNKMRVFQEEIFGPVVSVTTFKDEDEALAIANDTMYGLGAGVWTRDGTRAYRFGRDIEAGRVWVNNYHAYPAHAAFGGYKQSGIGRETHKMMLDHYQQTKNMLVSYNPNKLGLLLIPSSSGDQIGGLRWRGPPFRLRSALAGDQAAGGVVADKGKAEEDERGEHRPAERGQVEAGVEREADEFDALGEGVQRAEPERAAARLPASSTAGKARRTGRTSGR